MANYFKQLCDAIEAPIFPKPEGIGYYDHKVLSNSTLNRLYEDGGSPLAVYNALNGEWFDTPELAFGRAWHVYVGEGEEKFAEDFLVLPPVAKEPKEPKAPRKPAKKALPEVLRAYELKVAEYEELAEEYRNAYDKYEFTLAERERIQQEAKANRKEAVELETVYKLDEMRQALRRDNRAFRLYYLETPGPVESEYFFSIKGLDIKIRRDKVCPSLGVIPDLKTTKSIGKKSFTNSIDSFGYARASAIYTAGTIHEDTWNSYEGMVFIAQEKTFPYRSATYTISPEFLNYGAKQWLDGVDLVNKCYKSGKWPGPEYQSTRKDGAVVIDKSPWLK